MRKIEEESKLDLLTLDFNRMLNKKQVSEQNEYNIMNNLKRLYYINEDLSVKNVYQPQFDLFKFVDKPVVVVKTEEIKKEEVKKEKEIVKKEEAKEHIPEKKIVGDLFPSQKHEKPNVFGNNTGGDFKLFGQSNQGIFGGTIEEKKKVEIPKNIQTLQNINLFPKPAIDEKKIIPQDKIEKVEKIEISKPIQIIPDKKPEQIQVKQITYKDKLIEASNKYWNSMRDILRIISNKPIYKKPTEKIELEINMIINQLNNQQEVKEKVQLARKILNEIYKERSEDLYIFAINLICVRVLIKCEKFVKEDKKNYSFLATFLYQIAQTHKSLQDFFFMLITYKCPYIIPKVYSKSEFPDKTTYMKRLGYSNVEENFTEWMNNMESYSYLYFCYLFNGNGNEFTDLVKNYLEILENTNVDPPITVAFKTFLNAIGGKYCKNVSGGVNILKKLTSKFLKGLEDLKSKSKATDIKQIATENIHFIKKYFTSISAGQQTEMYK